MNMTTPPSARDAVELFHLHFLRALTTGGDKARFVVKGGCNLRFFFGSPRYSEDLDVDATNVATGTLRKNVDKALASTALRSSLAQWGVAVGDASAPKQTDTTQRWKVGLRLDGAAVPLRTKVEFSRRKVTEPHAVDPIDAAVAARHHLVRHLFAHYRAPEAFVQKLRALVGRAEPQARDLFDLHLLLTASGVAALRVPADLRSEVPAAVERAASVSFDTYRSQVVAYLAADAAERYGTRGFFDELQDELERSLTELGS